MTWGVATALLEQRGNEGLFEVDEAWLPRGRRRARAAADRARQPVPRPARPLRRARAPRRRVGRARRGARRADRVRRSTPTTRWSPTSAATASCGAAPGVTYFGIEDPSQALPELQHAHDAKHCRRCGAPYEYERAFVGHLGHYTCPNCGADRPAPDVAATRIELDGMRGSRVDGPHPAGRAAPRASPSPASTTSTTRSRAIAAALRLGVDARADPRRASRRCGPCSGASRRSRSRGKPVSILLIKNPAGANEVLRTLRLEAGDAASSTSGSRSTTGSPTGATSPGSGTPTSSCSPAACAASSAPAPARPRWRCG